MFSRNHISVILLSALLLSLMSCRDDVAIWNDEVERVDNLPVKFEFNLPDIATRSLNAKRAFEDGEMIHVEGTFTMNDGTTSTKYAAFRYDGSKREWNQYAGLDVTTIERFTWPNNCVTAKFKAYYVYGSNSLLVPTGSSNSGSNDSGGSDDSGDNGNTGDSGNNGDAGDAGDSNAGSEDNNSALPVLFSSLASDNGDPDKDPLVAESDGAVKYGHTIVLNFTHVLAYLIIEEMPPMAPTFWFTRENEEGDDVASDFMNAFKFTLNSENHLNIEFLQVRDPQYDNLVYVAGKMETEWDDGVEKGSFGIFLAPGKYADFIIGYPGASSMVEYLTYSKSKVTIGDGADGGDTGTDTPDPEPEEGDDDNPPGESGEGEDEGDDENGEKVDANPENILEANGVYRFNISKSSGINIVNKQQKEEWDESEDPIYDVDAEKFLYAICNSLDYSITYEGEDVKILQKVGNGTQLLKNVNMNWWEYNVFGPNDEYKDRVFVPDLGRGNTFDGGYHYIWNLGSPLFNEVNGTIKNLGITNASITVTTMDSYVPDWFTPTETLQSFDLSRAGALCNYVREGTIQNIRVRSKLPATYDESTWEKVYNDIFEINAYIYALDAQEAHNIGCLFGSSLNGTVSGVNLMYNMDMNLTVENAEGTPAIPTLSIGGIIGQNVNQINSIATLMYESDDNNFVQVAPTITITNNCNFQNASYYIGGILGYHSGGTVDNVTLPSVTIDSRSSSGFASYIGGAVGGLSNASEGGELLNCVVSGTVSAGKSETFEIGRIAVSYTGGIAGECYQSFKVNGCRANVNVNGPGGSNYVAEGTTYATGGAFGRILKLNVPNVFQTPEEIGNIIASGQEVRGPSIYIGNFAGMAPDGETWENDYAPRSIIVSSHDNISKNIGNEVSAQPEPEPEPDQP